MKLHILTAITRPENLPALAASLTGALAHGVAVCWHWLADSEHAAIGGQALKNQMLDAIADGWVWVLDDDNTAHPDFFDVLSQAAREHPDARAFVLSQELPGGTVRHADAAAMRVDHVDIAQVVLRRDLIGDARLDLSYGGDGMLIEQLHRHYPTDFVYIDRPVCYYNRLRSS